MSELIKDHKITECPECKTRFKKYYVELLGRDLLAPGCDCYGKAYEQEKYSKRIDDLLEKSGIPIKYKNENMKDWQKVPGTEKLTDIVRKYVIDLKNNVELGKGMFVIGVKGTGKTKIQCYIGNKIIRKLRVNVYYISLAVFITKIEELKKNRGSVESYINKYVNCSVLILDDVGESNIDEWNRRYLFLLLDGRNNRKCVTLSNTMKTVEENNKRIGDHNVSRILEMAGENIVEIKSIKDMRFFKNREEQK